VVTMGDKLCETVCSAGMFRLIQRDERGGSKDDPVIHYDLIVSTKSSKTDA
jgi:hypothetical protein